MIKYSNKILIQLNLQSSNDIPIQINLIILRHKKSLILKLFACQVGNLALIKYRVFNVFKSKFQKFR